MLRKPFCHDGACLPPLQGRGHLCLSPRLLHVGASGLAGGELGRGPAQAAVSRHTMQPRLPWVAAQAPGTRPVFPELPVSFSRFSLEDFHLAHVLFVCVASSAIQRLKELQNETLQLSLTAPKAKMLFPLTSSFSELLYSSAKPS